MKTLNSIFQTHILQYWGNIIYKKMYFYSLLRWFRYLLIGDGSSMNIKCPILWLFRRCTKLLVHPSTSFCKKKNNSVPLWLTELFTISVLQWVILCFDKCFLGWRITKWEYPMAHMFIYISNGVLNKFLVPSPILANHVALTTTSFLLMLFYGWSSSF